MARLFNPVMMMVLLTLVAGRPSDNRLDRRA